MACISPEFTISKLVNPASKTKAPFGGKAYRLKGEKRKKPRPPEALQHQLGVSTKLISEVPGTNI